MTAMVQKTAEPPEPPPPVLAPTGDASLDVLVGDLNDTFAPFQELGSPDASNLHKANALIGGIMGAIQAPVTLLNDGFALATAGIAKLFPPLPAATLGMLHLGFPHTHVHPPAMPIPLPSLGPVALAGCASVLINGIPAARAGDIGIALGCGSLSPPFEVFTGSSKVFFGGARAARMLDITRHCQPGGAAGKAGMALMGVMAGVEILGSVSQAADAKDADSKTTTEEAEVKPAAEKAAEARKAAEAARAKAEAVAAAAAPRSWDDIDVDPAVEAAYAEAAEAAQAAAEAESEAEQEAAEAADAKDDAEAAHARATATAIQTGLDAAAMLLSLLMGLDPGAPPCFGALLTGMPDVLIGGFPMPPWGMFARGLGKLARLKRQPRKLQRKNDRTKCAGEPIDPVTGANVDWSVDYEERGAVLFRWGRSYTSADANRDGPMGRGFRHTYERSLVIDLDRALFTDAEGREIEFPLPTSQEPRRLRDGHALTLRTEGADIVYEVARTGDPTMEFRRAGHGTSLRLTALRTSKGHVEVHHDALGRLKGMVEATPSGTCETLLIYDDRGHILEVRRGPRGSELPLISAYGYDHAGCLVSWQDAAGARAGYAYDVSGRMVRKTSRGGYSFHYAYDDQGRCNEEHGEDGRWRVSLRYEPEDRRTIVTQVDGGEWTYEYDENLTVVAIQDPQGGRKERVLDEEGRVLCERGPGSRVLTMLYDATGHHYGILDRFGYQHPPLDVEPDPFNPLMLALRAPAGARAQQWGSALETLSLTGALAEWLPSPGLLGALGGLRVPGKPQQIRDVLGRVVEEIDEAGHRSEIAYDGAGNVIRHVDRDGCERRALITSWNLIGAEVDPLGHRTDYDYTMRSEIARIVDPGGSESRYEYDLKDRLVRVLHEGVVHSEYSYDINDGLTEKRDGAGDVLLRIANGANGVMSGCNLASGETFRYGYDERGRVTRASTDTAEVSRRFDALGRLVLDERDGRGVRHDFDLLDLRATTYFGRFTVSYRRAGDGSLVIETPVNTVERIRVGDHGSVRVALGNGTSTLVAYDHEGLCQGRVVWRTRHGKVALWSAQYTYSPEGELRRIDDNARGRSEYTYDAAHRLVSETRPDGTTAAVVLDAAGNVLEKPGLPRAELTAGNRLRAAGDRRFRYNRRNHLAEEESAGATTRYRYNSLDMLVGVSWSDREEEWTAGYDGIRRRVYKALGSARTELYWDDHRLAAEVGPTGAVRLYVYPGPEALVPLLFIDYDSVDAAPASGRIFYPIGNQIGVPLHIEDQAGNVVWRAAHVDPYGAVEIDPASTVAYSLRFPGHYLDEETGLHYNRFRYYSPRLGRYLQSDPMGQAGGINLYAYPANPLVDVDVLGLMQDPHAPLNDAQSTPQVVVETRPGVTFYKGTRSKFEPYDGPESSPGIMARWTVGDRGEPAPGTVPFFHTTPSKDRFDGTGVFYGDGKKEFGTGFYTTSGGSLDATGLIGKKWFGKTNRWDVIRFDVPANHLNSILPTDPGQKAFVDHLLTNSTGYPGGRATPDQNDLNTINAINANEKGKVLIFPDDKTVPVNVKVYDEIREMSWLDYTEHKDGPGDYSLVIGPQQPTELGNHRQYAWRGPIGDYLINSSERHHAHSVYPS
jgi:RHS repeat-associated protein